MHRFTMQRPWIRQHGPGQEWPRFSATFSYQPRTVRVSAPRWLDIARSAAGRGGSLEDCYDNESVMRPDGLRLPGAAGQGVLQALNQVCPVEWLAQKTQRAVLQGMPPDVGIRIRSDEDDRQTAALGNQNPLQFQPAKSGHLHIGDQAGSAETLLRLQEILGRPEGLHLVAK